MPDSPKLPPAVLAALGLTACVDGCDPKQLPVLETFFDDAGDDPSSACLNVAEPQTPPCLSPVEVPPVAPCLTPPDAVGPCLSDVGPCLKVALPVPVTQPIRVEPCLRMPPPRPTPAPTVRPCLDFAPCLSPPMEPCLSADPLEPDDLPPPRKCLSMAPDGPESGALPSRRREVLAALEEAGALAGDVIDRLG